MVKNPFFSAEIRVFSCFFDEISISIVDISVLIALFPMCAKIWKVEQKHPLLLNGANVPDNLIEKEIPPKIPPHSLLTIEKLWIFKKSFLNLTSKLMFVKIRWNKKMWHKFANWKSENANSLQWSQWCCTCLPMQRPSQRKREKKFSENLHLTCNVLTNSFRISRSPSKDVVVFSP